MEQIIGLLSNHGFFTVVKALLAFWAFSAVVDALPQPGDSKFYQFVFKALHGFAGNLKKAAAKFNLPGGE